MFHVTISTAPFFFLFYFPTKRYSNAKEQMNKINNNSYLNDIDEREEDWKNEEKKRGVNRVNNDQNGAVRSFSKTGETSPPRK